MENYDELVKRLREPCPHENCILSQQAADTIDELQKPRWISVKDAMPEECEDVLLLFEHNQAVGFWTGIGWSINSGDDFYTSLDFAEPYPTHWMPLPSTEGLNG